MCVFEDKRLQRTVKGRQGKAVGSISPAALLFDWSYTCPFIRCCDGCARSFLTFLTLAPTSTRNEYRHERLVQHAQAGRIVPC
jgi:hypothetical protein